MFESLETLDRNLLLSINATHSPVVDVIMWYASKTWPTVLLVLFVAYFVYRKFHLKRAMEFILGCALVAATADLTSNTVKHGVKRFRPTHNTEIREKIRLVNAYQGGKYGFFSGHASTTFGVATFMILVVNWLRKRYMFLIGLYAFLVVYSRMYLGVHYPSDIFFGILTGILFGWLGFIVMNTFFMKLDEQKT
jgi:undecaprenyl-diphosphatase